MHISVIIYVALAKSIPAEAPDTHAMDEQNLATAGQTTAGDESPRDGAKNAPRWEFCSEVFLVGFSWVFHGTCQPQVCSF